MDVGALLGAFPRNKSHLGPSQQSGAREDIRSFFQPADQGWDPPRAGQGSTGPIPLDHAPFLPLPQVHEDEEEESEPRDGGPGVLAPQDTP